MSIELRHEEPITLSPVVPLTEGHYADVMAPVYSDESRVQLRDDVELTNYLWGLIAKLRPQTAHHSVRVANYYTMMMRYVDKRAYDLNEETYFREKFCGQTYSPEFIEYHARTIGLLHDIGKIAPSFWSIYGPKRENPKMTGRWHASTGASILSELGYHFSVERAVVYHHENYDGSGKPFGLSKWEIHQDAAILRYADYFDTCCCRMPVEKTIEHMNSKIGTVFDPHLRYMFDHFSATILEQSWANPHLLDVYKPFQAGKKPAGE